MSGDEPERTLSSAIGFAASLVGLNACGTDPPSCDDEPGTDAGIDGGIASCTVMLSAADFATLATNQNVMVVSTSDDGHTHSIAVRCA